MLNVEVVYLLAKSVKVKTAELRRPRRAGVANIEAMATTRGMIDMARIRVESILLGSPAVRSYPGRGEKMKLYLRAN